ncbi:MAG: hypothetical protein C4519_11930 [Desulfobacteraceae bacterium]|nr:MAG: hypothetical protein C4519_11930 [Desulfobacteraceae bacterium]
MIWFWLGIAWLAAGNTPISAEERKPMQQLDVMATEKKYKHFQFFGFVDGMLVGAVNLNGTPMHTLSGESGNISNNAAQYAAKYDENVIGVEITRGAGEIEYALPGAAGDEDGFDADHHRSHRCDPRSATVSVAQGVSLFPRWTGVRDLKK